MRIGGNPGEPPLAQVQRAHANLKVWPLIVSRGHDLQVRSLDLDDPTFNLIREPDGRWSLPGGSVENRGPGGKRGELLISRLSVHGGEVHLLDRAPHGHGEGIALNHVEVSARDLGSDQGSSLSVTAALGADHPNLKLNLTSKASRWQGTVDVESVEVDRLRALLPAGVEVPVTGGRLALTASLNTLPGGALEAQGHVDARGLSMNGRPVSASTDFAIQHSARTLALTQIHVTGPGVALAGSASMKDPHQLQFSLAGPLLDLDALQAALPAANAPRSPSAPGKEPQKNVLGGFSASGHVAIARVTLGRLTLEQVSADANLEGGQVTVTHASASAYGGTATVSRASVDLMRPVPRWSLSAQLSGLDFGRATQSLAGKRLLEGTLQAQLHLAGTGLQWAQLREGMTGSGSFSVHGGAWTSTDLEQALAAPLLGAVQGVGRGLSGGASGASAPHPTPLRGLDGSFELARGALRFHQPLRAQSSFGDASLTGTVGLDQRLDLKGTVQLQPAFVTRIVALQPVKPITAPITIQGTLAAPKIDVNQGDVAKGLLRSTPPENLIRRGLHGLFGLGHKS